MQNQNATAKVDVRLVVVEEHAQALDADLSVSEPAATVFVRQAGGEPSSDFTRRVAKQIATLERSGRNIGSAIIALASAVDDTPKAARYVLACLLLAHAGRQRGPDELVLMVDGNAGPSVRHSVMDIIEALVCESGAAFIPIRVHFHVRKAVIHSTSSIELSRVGDAER